MKTFKKGDKVKVQFGGNAMIEANNGNPKFKRGTFSHYSESGKFGYLFHGESGTLLKRPAGEILNDK